MIIDRQVGVQIPTVCSSNTFSVCLAAVSRQGFLPIPAHSDLAAIEPCSRKTSIKVSKGQQQR